MYNLVKKGAWMLLVASLAAGMVACDDDDPDYSNVQPPVVEVAASHISGVVTTMGGQPVSGAAVKASFNGQALNATTDAQGVYRLNDLAKGTYALEVSAEGKLTVKGQVSLSKDGESAVFNAMLANAGQEVEVSATEDRKLTLVTETLPENEAAEVKTEIVIPAEAVAEEGVKIIVTPVYGEGMVNARAIDHTMLLGMRLEATQAGVELKEPIILTFDVTAGVAAVAQVKKTVNGTVSAADAQVQGDKIVVKADELGLYSLMLDIDFTSATTTEAVAFSQDAFDNLYGAKDLTVTKADYTFKSGSDLQVPAEGVLAAHLRQALAVKYGAADVTEMKGSYDLNVTLPIGTALELQGMQQVTTVTATVGQVSGTVKNYGNVTVSATTYNRKHNGGSAGGL